VGGAAIVAFEVDIAAGAVQSISNIPIGWYITIDNNASWQTRIKANSQLGSASLTPQALSKCEIVVRKNEFGDLKFQVTGTVSSTKDYREERQVHLSMGDFSVTPLR
jgi:hypothetical protein